jgi:hypothetical protein
MSLTLGALATWRVTHLLAAEDGPGKVVARLRARVGRGPAAELMDCFDCLSLWIAAPLAWLICPGRSQAALAWLGLSGAACLLERATSRTLVLAPPDDLEADA